MTVTSLPQLDTNDADKQLKRVVSSLNLSTSQGEIRRHVALGQFAVCQQNGRLPAFRGSTACSGQAHEDSVLGLVSEA